MKRLVVSCQKVKVDLKENYYELKRWVEVHYLDTRG